MSTEDSAVQSDKAGGKQGWALGVAAAAVTAAFAWAMIGGGTAAAQTCPTEYCVPTPTPTPTGTPFQNPQPPAPPKPSSGPKLMSPFPKVRTAGSYTRTKTIFTRVTVRAPKGAKVDAACSGKRCKRTRRTAGSKMMRLSALQASFPAKTTLTIRITGSNAIGKYVEIRTRRGKPPLRRDRCLKPGSASPSGCPTG
jgi:hypothetical protein